MLREVVRGKANSFARSLPFHVPVRRLTVAALLRLFSSFFTSSTAYVFISATATEGGPSWDERDGREY